MLENGLAAALIDCVLDGHLCGFSKAELTSWQGAGVDFYLKNVLPYVNGLLRGIIVLAAFLRECQTHPRDTLPAEALVNADMRAMWCASHQVWRMLWDIHTPFLDSQPRGRAYTYGSPMRLQHNLHYFSAVLASYEASSHPSYPEPAHEVHAESRQDRTRALIEAKVAVAYEEFHLGDCTWSDLYEAAVAGRAQGREQLRKAVVRGSRAEENIAQTVHSLFTFVCAVRPAHELDEARKKNLIPRGVLVGSIAGWRTQISMSGARGVAPDDAAIYRAMRWQFNYLVSLLVNEREELPERHILGVVLLISQHIGSMMLPVVFPYLPPAALPLCAPGQQRAGDAAVARSSTMDTLDCYRSSTSYPRGRRAWMSLREPLEVAKYTNHVPERDGPPGPGLGRVRVPLPPTDAPDARVHRLPHGRALPGEALDEGPRQPLPRKTGGLSW